ncbi:MAG: tetratricopeptide repeat protein [Acidobacteriota bacterium]|nr:tetratricopeptide repeat protein [Acidobacteriota bacterium]
MSFDKIKAMRNAERYLSQGKIRAAIGEYKQIVEHDPKDFSTLNILGDLYTKNAEKTEAVRCFTRVAEYYGKQGFAQKAIAIYNKISRLQPDSTEVSAKLAELYQMKGSLSEARSHYVALAGQYDRVGKKIEALAIWKKIAELDPNDTDVFLKIAESYLQENQTGEAADAFITAGERLAKQGKFDAALAIFSRTLEIRENDFKALDGFVKAQISLGDTEEAAKTLEKILEKQPFNREILYLLVDCHLDTNNPHEAEKAIIKLVEQEPANYPKFLELIEVYIRNGDLESASRTLSMSSEHLLVGGQASEFLKWTNEILARNPEQIEALHLLVRYYGWQRDESELKEALERLAEGAKLTGSIEDERYALAQLVMIVPHESRYAQRLHEINTEYDFAEDVPVTPILVPPVNFEDFASEESSFDAYPAVRFEESKEGAPEFATNGFGNFHHDAASLNGFDDGTKDFVFSGDTFDAKIVEEFDEDEYDSFGKTGKIFDEDFNAVQEVPERDELSASDELKLEKEFESIQFYVAQGYKELAEKSIAALEDEFGSRPEFVALRDQMDDSLQTLAEKTAPLVEVVEENAGISFENNYAEPETESFVQEKSFENGAQSFDYMNDFQNHLGFEESESSKEDSDYETHYHTAIAYKEMGLTEDSIRAFQDAINLVSPNDGTRRFFACAHLLGHCFMEKMMPNLALMWYKRALETSNLTNEEKQGIWYEIGNAYEVGGDSEKAIENFGMVYAVDVDYRDVSARIQTLHVNG